MARCFALQTFVKTFIILFPCMDIDTRLTWTIPASILTSPSFYWTDFFPRQVYISLGLTSRETILFVPQRYFCTGDTWKCIENNKSRFCWDIGKLFSLQSIHEHFVFRQYMLQLCLIMLISYRELSSNPLHIGIALRFFTLANKWKISIHLEVVKFAMVKVDNFCKE